MPGCSRLLADRTRLRLVSMVAAREDGEACVCDLTQPAISHHLKILVEAGIFTRDKRGVWACYALVPGLERARGSPEYGKPGPETGLPGQLTPALQARL